MRARAVASYLIEEDQIEVIGFAEEPSGGGRSFLIQIPRCVEEGEETYNLSTETGASEAGGIEALIIDYVNNKVSIALSSVVSDTLGIEEALAIHLDVPADEGAAVYAALERFAIQEGISIRNTRARTMMTTVQVSILPPGTEAFSDELRQQLRWAFPGTERTEDLSDVLEVAVDSIAACEKVGSAIAQWVSTTSADFHLRICGPGADSELRAVRTGHDEHYISGLLASAAYLQ